MADLDPLINQWYLDMEHDALFYVVAIDEQEDSVEIQFFDGNIDKIPLNYWYLMNIEPAEPPEDWTGALEKVDADDADFDEAEFSDEPWSDEDEEEEDDDRSD